VQLKSVLKLFLFITDGHEGKSSLFVDYKILQIRLMFASVATISNKKLLSFSKHNGKKVSVCQLQVYSWLVYCIHITKTFLVKKSLLIATFSD
jgi:hypothetical protein